MEQRRSSLQRRMSAFGTKRTSRQAEPMSAFDPKADIVTSSRLVDHLVSCVVNYDGRLEILKLWLASKGGLDSFLKFRPMPQLRGLDAFPVVNPAAPTRFFIKQECFTDQIWISSPTRYRKAILRNSFFAAHSIWQAKQHDLRNHGATSLW